MHALEHAEALRLSAGQKQALQKLMDEHKAEARKVFVENLRFATQNAGNLTLLLEPINQRDKPGYFYSSIGEAANLGCLRITSSQARWLIKTMPLGAPLFVRA